MRAGRIAAALMLPMLIPAASMAQAQEPALRTITVSAQGTVEREPEQGVVLLAVESVAQTARAAADMNAERMTQLNGAVRRAGVPDRSIRTVSYQLTPEYAPIERGSDRPRIVGYRALNMVQVTVDTITRMGAVIDGAIGAGANRVANISFQLRDPQAAYREAVADAVRNARREAETVATAAGETLGPVQSISTGGFYSPRAAMGAVRLEAMSVDAPTPIEGGTLTITANASVVYQLVPPR